MPTARRAGKLAAVRVLMVADDDGVSRCRLHDALTTHGHAVTRADRAADVWPRLREAELVLLDLGLPDGDGLDVLRRLRKLSECPVLVLTARGAERDVVRRGASRRGRLSGQTGAIAGAAGSDGSHRAARPAGRGRPARGAGAGR